jgi:asparagine synthase (glutamine-hydrolysing)
LLARDHAGIKPLYYLLTSEGLVFASQYDQIMSHPWARQLPVSRDALALYLRLGYIPAPFALLENTYMLEPGTWLEVNADGHTTRGTFYEFPRFREPDLRGDAACEAVDAAVTRAVRRQLISDVPLGTFLSGGIDSPLVTAKMRAMRSGPVHAFTLGTNHDHLDESSDALAYAREIGVEHTIEHVTPETALAMLDDVVAACGEPFADYSIFPTMLIARLARRRVTVMLSGDGGDELFWGYAGRFASVLDESNGSRRPPALSTLRRQTRRLFRASDRHARTIGERYQAKHTRISDTALNRIFLDPPEWPRGFELFAYTGGDPSTTAQWLRWNEFVGHLTMVLLKVDRASMYHALEVRVPLLDREVIDVAARIDWASCLDTRRRVGKMPLRAALARHVSHQTTTKRGFEVPMSAWLRGPLQAVFEEAVLDRKEILDLPLDRRELRRMFLRHVSNGGEQAPGLWTLLSLALWEEEHYRHRSSALLRPPGS